MEPNEILQLLNEKASKVRSAMTDGNTYDEINGDIDFIFQCAFDKRIRIGEYGAIRLFDLAEVTNDIRERIIQIMETGNAHQKFTLICQAVTLNLPGDFVRKIVFLAIRDKSKKVKIKGAEIANSLNLYEFATAIKEEYEKANDKEIKEDLSNCFLYLTKGYRIEFNPEHGNRIYTADHSSMKVPNGMTNADEINKFVLTKYAYMRRIQDLYFS